MHHDYFVHEPRKQRTLPEYMRTVAAFVMILLSTILPRRYGSDAIEGLTVWGKWDSELYVKHNEDIEGEHGWSHFRSE